jgi:hypothetical protein
MSKNYGTHTHTDSQGATARKRTAIRRTAKVMTAGAALVFGATACSNSHALDSDAEDTAPAPAPTYLDVTSIETQLAGTGRPSDPFENTAPQITEVVCPDDVVAGVSVSFHCTATGQSGLSGEFTVTLADEAGRSFSYEGELSTDGYTLTVSGDVTGASA